MLNKEEATELTNRIRSNVSEFSKLMLEAKDGRVWEPLGYAGFKEWLTEAVGISRSRGYQLLNIAHTEAHLKDIFALPEEFTLSDISTRAIIQAGETNFIQQIQPDMGNDTGENEQTLLNAIITLRGNPAPTPVVEIHGEPISADHTIKNMIATFATHAADLPEAAELDEQALVSTRQSLRKAIDEAQERLTEYETALEHTPGSEQAV